jgi:hypothetical protein
MIEFDEWTARGVWGAPPPFRAPAAGVVVHHSVTRVTNDGFADAQTVENVIYQRGGFAMVAYSFLLHPDGTVFEGRGSRYRNGANRNDKGGLLENSNTVSVCCIGDYRTDRVTAAQQTAFSRLLSDLRRDGIVAVDAVLVPHGDLAYTACPANAYDELTGPSAPIYDDDDEVNDMLTLIDSTTNEGWVAAGNIARVLSDPDAWLATWEGPIRRHGNMRYVIGDLYDVVND